MTIEILENHYKSTVDLMKDTSNPTLVLDAGMGNWSLFFQPLAQELRKFAKVCLVSRDGYLDSISSSTSTDTYFIAHQLKRMLDDKKIHEPIILVGHSLGGLHVRLFHHLFPNQVQGLILIDSAHPYLLDVLPEVKSNLKKQIRLTNILKLLARLRLLEFAKANIPTFGLPPDLHTQYHKVTTQAKYGVTYQAEMKKFESMLTVCKPLSDLGNLPLLIICSPYGLNVRINEKSKSERQVDKAWLSLQEDLTGLSSKSTFIKSKGDHFLHLTDTVFIANVIKSFIEHSFHTHLTTKSYYL